MCTDVVLCVLLLQSVKTKMAVFSWSILCSCLSYHTNERTLYETTGYGPRTYPILCACYNVSVSFVKFSSDNSVLKGKLRAGFSQVKSWLRSQCEWFSGSRWPRIKDKLLQICFHLRSWNDILTTAVGNFRWSYIGPMMGYRTISLRHRVVTM